MNKPSFLWSSRGRNTRPQIPVRQQPQKHKLALVGKLIVVACFLSGTAVLPSAGTAQWRSDPWPDVTSPVPRIERAAANMQHSESLVALRALPFSAPLAVAGETGSAFSHEGDAMRGALRGALIGGAITGVAWLAYISFASDYWEDCFSPSDAFLPCPVEAVIGFGYYAIPGAVIGAMYGASTARQAPRER